MGQVLNTAKIDSLKSLLKSDSNPIIKVIHYNLLAEEYQELEPEKSTAFLLKALPISKKYKISKNIADYNRISAKTLLNQGKYDLSISHAEAAGKIYLNLKDTTSYLSNLPILARATKEAGNIDKAIFIADNGIKITRNHKFSYEIGLLYFELCFYFNVKDDIYKALLYLDKAENAFALSSQKLRGFTKCYQQRSQIYTKTNQHKKAIFYAEKAIKIAKELKTNQNVFSILYSTLGVAYFNDDDNKNAVKFLQFANDLNKTTGPIERRAFNLVMLSQAYVGLKMYKEAIRIAKIAISLVDDKENALMAYGIIGNAYYELKNYEAALVNQIAALKLIELVEDKDHQRSSYQDIARTYSNLGDYKNAYDNLNKYADLEISFLKNINEKKVNELEIKFESKQKDLALKEFTISKQKQKLEILKQKNFNNILLIIIIFIFILTLVILVAFSKNKKINKLLNSKNELISDKITLVEEQKLKLSHSLLERELLLKEIHHRVKNNLQIIMSLLNIQAHNSKTLDINKFKEKVQSRILSMSLIHQNLYENETIDGIDFNIYTNQIADNLLHLFGLDDKKIKLEIKAKDMFFDLQTAIPLGLILNELFTNTFKYAFNDFKNAKINVEITKTDNDQFVLYFSDNGSGYTPAENVHKSLGLELIQLLASQLKGSVSKIETNGTKYKIDFKTIL